MLPLLFVDDDRMAREMAITFFKREGLAIDVAATVKEAKEKIKANFYKTVVTDLMMPLESGMDLMEWIADKYPRMQVLFATSHCDLTGYIKTASKYKAYCGYVLKPLTPTRVKMALTGSENMVEYGTVLRFR